MKIARAQISVLPTQERSAEDHEEDYPGDRTTDWEWQQESFQPYPERIDRTTPSNPYTAGVDQHRILDGARVDEAVRVSAEHYRRSRSADNNPTSGYQKAHSFMTIAERTPLRLQNAVQMVERESLLIPPSSRHYVDEIDHHDECFFFAQTQKEQRQHYEEAHNLAIH